MCFVSVQIAYPCFWGMLLAMNDKETCFQIELCFHCWKPCDMPQAGRPDPNRENIFENFLILCMLRKYHLSGSINYFNSLTYLVEMYAKNNKLGYVYTVLLFEHIIILWRVINVSLELNTQGAGCSPWHQISLLKWKTMLSDLCLQLHQLQSHGRANILWLCFSQEPTKAYPVYVCVKIFPQFARNVCFYLKFIWS